MLSYNSSRNSQPFGTDMSDRIGVDAVPLWRQDCAASSGPAHFHFVARMLHSQRLGALASDCLVRARRVVYEDLDGEFASQLGRFDEAARIHGSAVESTVT